MYTITMQLFQKPLAHYTVFIGLYLILTQILPANKFALETYGLTPLRYHLLLLLVVLPFIGIWYAAFYSFSRLKTYATAIQKSPEGQDFRQLAIGSGWLAYALPTLAFTTIIINSLTDSYPARHPAAIIFNNYLSLILPFIAFTILSNSARQLANRANLRLSMGAARGLIAIFIVLGVAYGYFSFNHLSHLSLTASDNIYYLPVWLVVVSIMIPYLYAWFIGLLAAYEIMLFAKQVKGVIYRQALRSVAYGLAIVIVSSIALQFVNCVMPYSSSSGTQQLNSVLIGVFIVELLSAIGYGFIAVGARRLIKIEEV